MKRSKSLSVLFILAFSLVWQTHVFSQKQQSVFPKKEWIQSSPAQQQMDSLKMIRALDSLGNYLHKDGLSETMIIRNGVVVFQGENVKKTHSIWSCSKSFTTTVLGILIKQGKCNLEDYAWTYEPLLKEKYPKLKLKHLANMTSGYSAVGDDRWDDWESEDWSWTPYKPDTPYAEPGEAFRYWDESMMMLGRVLTQIAKQPQYEVIKSALTSKIDFGDWYWKLEKDIKGMPINNGCTDVHINATQLARMGLLFLNKGNWNGKQLLDPAWVEQATTNQVPADAVLQTDVRNLDGLGKYGYGWWVRGDKKDMPNTPSQTYYMSGYNNNVCFIVPEWNLVFVRMGKDGNPEEGKRFVYDIFFKYLKDAIKK